MYTQIYIYLPDESQTQRMEEHLVPKLNKLHSVFWPAGAAKAGCKNVESGALNTQCYKPVTIFVSFKMIGKKKKYCNQVLMRARTNYRVR